MADINRKDLKHDHFVEEVGHQVEYFNEHRNAIIVGAIAVLAIIVGGAFYISHQRNLALDSMEALQTAAVDFSTPVSVSPEPGVKAYATSGERMREVGASLETVKTDFPGTEAAAAADYYYALLDIEQEALAAAKAKLQSAIAGASDEYGSLARLALAGILSSEGDTDGARHEYELLVEDPTTAVPAARAQLALARMLAESDPEAARPLLEELADTAGAAAASAAADELSKLPQI